MDIKDIAIIVGFALITTWGLDYFVLSRYRSTPTDEIKSGQSFSAPQRKQVIKPLNVEIDFIDQKRVAPEVVTEVHTDWGYLTFSSEGAAIERLEFKHGTNVDERIITIYPAVAREDKAFLVALDEKTPYYFTLVAKKENDSSVILTYEGSFGDGILLKRFTISKQIHKIDLALEIKPNAGVEREVQARLFYPSPVMPDIKYDALSAVVSNVKGSIEKIAAKKVNLQEGWWAPSIFGSENKYFVHALIADPDGFVERAYYTTTPEDRLISILEGQSVQDAKEGSWTISFYCGPKDAQAMAPVNEQLEETLDYSGILAPLSKLLLNLLNFLYSYIHNYGLAILLLTMLIKLVMLPFTLKGERSMKKSTDLQKKMKHLQQKYRNDPERLRLEQAELIKKYGMPQLTGCLPMLVQIPIFIALSRVLSNSIELYRAPFFGWITDLSAPDPYYILPVIIVLSMLGQAMTGDQKQRMMMMSMALVFGAISANFSSGLVLYIASGTLLGVLQTMLQKKMKVA